MTLCEQWVQDRHEPSSSFLGGTLLTKLWYQSRRSDIKFLFSHYCGMVGQGKAANQNDCTIASNFLIGRCATQYMRSSPCYSTIVYLILCLMESASMSTAMLVLSF